MVLLALAMAFSSGGCGDQAPGQTTAVEAPGEANTPPPPPSRLARRLFNERQLAAFTSAADEVGLDWPVLAAVAHFDPVAGRGADRVAGIAYQLAASGAPTDYESALSNRGGPDYTRRVLTLAGRLPSTGAGRADLGALPMAGPVDGRVMAVYGERFGALHDGLDIAAELGSPITAPAPGIVVSAAFEPAYGNRTCLAHRLRARPRPRELISCYGNQAGLDVQAGDRVALGETIGRVGCSGPCLRPHVHLQILDGASMAAPTTDPAPFFAIPTGRSIGHRFSLEAR